MATPFQLGWFSTGRDKAARDLLEVVHRAIMRREIRARLAFVFCNRDPGESAETDLFVEQAKGYGIPLVCCSYRKFAANKGFAELSATNLPEWRLEYDREVMGLLRDFCPDLCVLAGYMLVVGKEMCQRYNMVNLHPAAPGGPAGTWQEVIWRLIETGTRRTGVMMHLVTPELDKGPVVTFCTYSVSGKPFDKYWREIAGRPVGEIREQEGEDNALFKLIRRHGVAREFPLIISTIKAFADGRIRIAGKQVVDAGGKPIRDYDLTAEIDEELKKGKGGEIDG